MDATDYAYDVLGRRVAKMFDVDFDETVDIVENYVLDGQHVAIEQQNSSGSTHQYRMMWANAVDQLLAVQEEIDSVSKIPAWVLPDHQGTIRDYIARENAQVDSKLFRTVNYNAVGWHAGSEIWDANISTDFTNALGGFTYGNAGQKFDAESGLQYSRARYYDGFTTEFISQDPISFAGGDTNLYRRVGNSPANATDPSGEIVVSGTLLTAAAIYVGWQALFAAGETGIEAAATHAFGSDEDIDNFSYLATFGKNFGINLLTGGIGGKAKTAGAAGTIPLPDDSSAKTPSASPAATATCIAMQATVLTMRLIRVDTLRNHC